MPNKTLIVGLGSTGAEIASRALDRIVEKVGSLDKVPWVEVLALDTAPVRREYSVAATGNYVNIGLAETDFRTFKQNPRNLGKIEFEDWADPTPFDSVHASTRGAGNCRMIGRASFLYPSTFRQFHDAVKSRLDRLKSVDLPAALDAAKIEADHPNNLHYSVFVVGSLMGGTCSGSFIDVGYYLRSLGDTYAAGGGQFSVTGIFSAPSASYGTSDNAKRQMGNVFAALTELNHYLTDGVAYRQKFAMDERPVEFRGEAPFHGTYIVIPRSADAGEVMLAHAAVGDFVSATAMSDMVDTVETKLIDPSASLAGIRHKGRHLNFATLGVSVLEYPGHRIRLACSERLVSQALTAFNTARIDPGDPEAFLNSTLNLSLQGVRERLLAPVDGGDSLSKRVQSVLTWAEHEIRSGNPSATSTAAERIDAAFSASQAPTGALPANLVHSTVNQNLPAVQNFYETRIRERLDDALVNLREGPNWCKRLLEVLAQACKRIEDERTGPSAHESSTDLANGLEKQKRWVLEADQSTFRPYRKAALAHTAENWRRAAQRYYDQRINEACGAVEKDLLLRLAKLAETAWERLDGEENARSMVKMIQREIRDSSQASTDLSVPPVVNGISTFDGAIDAAYRESMDALANTNAPGLEGLHGEEYAKALLIRTAVSLKKTLYGEKSPFDPRTSGSAEESTTTIESQYRKALRDAAMKLFEAATDKDVLEEVYGSAAHPDATARTKTDKLWSLSEPMADIDPNDGPLAPAGEGNDYFTPAFAFFYQAKSPEFPYHNFGQALSLPLDRRVNTSDKTKAFVIRARLGFSAEQITAVSQYRDGAEWWHRHSQGRIPLFSRRDVAWYPLDGSPLKPGLDEAMDLAVLACALGLIQRTNIASAPYVVQLPRADMSVPVRLVSDIEWMAYQILGGERTDDAIEVYLRNTIAGMCEAATRQQVVNQVRHMVNFHQTTHPDLSYRNRALGSEEVESRLLHALDRFPQALEKYYQTFRDPNINTPDTYYRAALHPAAGRGLPDGYYCNGHHRDDGTPCNRHLKDPEPNREKLMSEFPEVCPNCGKQLLKPGFNRYWRLLVDGLIVEPELPENENYGFGGGVPEPTRVPADFHRS
jgi:hypothetical protein